MANLRYDLRHPPNTCLRNDKREQNCVVQLFTSVLACDAEHLDSLDNLSSSSLIDLKQVEEDYFCKIERSRYEVVYKRKKSGGGKTIANVEVDNDES